MESPTDNITYDISSFTHDLIKDLIFMLKHDKEQQILIVGSDAIDVQLKKEHSSTTSSRHFLYKINIDVNGNSVLYFPKEYVSNARFFVMQPILCKQGTEYVPVLDRQPVILFGDDLSNGTVDRMLVFMFRKADMQVINFTEPSSGIINTHNHELDRYLYGHNINTVPPIISNSSSSRQSQNRYYPFSHDINTVPPIISSLSSGQPQNRYHDGLLMQNAGPDGGRGPRDQGRIGLREEDGSRGEDGLQGQMSIGNHLNSATSELVAHSMTRNSSDRIRQASALLRDAIIQNNLNSANQLMQEMPSNLANRSVRSVNTGPVLAMPTEQSRPPSDETKTVCCVCLTNENQVTAQCGHLLCCECLRALPSNPMKKCPTCRVPIESFIRVYL
jgi:hypothetical protein